MQSPHINNLIRIKDLSYQDTEFQLEMVDDPRYNLSINEIMSQHYDSEKQRQSIILEMFTELLEIVESVNKIECFDSIYFETVELIHKYYDNLMKASFKVFRYWHMGQCYCPENSCTYVRLKHKMENQLTPTKENVLIMIGDAKYFTNTYN